MFLGHFKSVSRKFQECFLGILSMFQGSFKIVSRKFQGCFKKVSRVFQGSFNCVSRIIQGCFNKVWSFKGVLRNFQGCFKKVSRVFHRSFKGVSWNFHESGSFMDVTSDSWFSRVFPECVKAVLIKFQWSFNNIFKVSKKSFMLHGTHCSFPSKRRACWIIRFIFMT